MTDYTELIRQLKTYEDGYGLYDDAADAIEALETKIRESMQKCAECGDANMPKRGEWIRHPEVKNIYGGEYIECPFCGEKYVVQYIADEKFCRNCGSDLRAKMEVQDG